MGGLGHPSKCLTTIHSDGTVQVELGSQDLGTGTRTVIGWWRRDAGLPVGAIQVRIGDTKYPPSGPSGGSTTVGGVSASTRKSAMNALAKALRSGGAGAGASRRINLETADSRIQLKGNPSKNLNWQAACRKLGARDHLGDGRERAARVRAA